ncbi:alpha/beta fold hydrolase [Streptomyces liliifuscus]|uniref:Uncharacterized protein n=1 Tax=Streptomyces liliifuscus TaxID=2797636 RepID=A0A7T7L307_9ACTN|nr:hypothetical protein [Streptomyces liliifuscus]QQM45497.1 hypothetical protein JEQ17_42865 [Streptomyces liliifuscus]
MSDRSGGHRGDVGQFADTLARPAAVAEERPEKTPWSPADPARLAQVLAPLAAAGHQVIAPDCRGAGASAKPRDGYDKGTMAGVSGTSSARTESNSLPSGAVRFRPQRGGSRGSTMHRQQLGACAARVRVV